MDRDKRLAGVRRLIVASLLAGTLATAWSCAAERDPPEISVSWLAPQNRAARPLDCQLPQLSALPNTDYQQIAIVEVADDYNADDREIYGLARRKVCETGADAMVVLEDQRQERGKPAPEAAAGGGRGGKPVTDVPQVGEAGHKGRILTAVAIIYPNAAAADNGAAAH